MNLADYELLPGIISSTNDPQKIGRLKVSVPGGESLSNCQLDAIPWCYPISMTGTYQGFTKLVEGGKVWVLRNKLNRFEMWYWPMFELNPNTEEIVSGYDNTEVLVSRDLGGSNVYIYYTDGQGIVLSIGTSKININNKGEIVLTSNNKGKITIAEDKVLLNADDLTLNAVSCQPLTEALKGILSCFNSILSIANKTWTLYPIYKELSSKVAELDATINREPWKCENIGVS